MDIHTIKQVIVPMGDDFAFPHFFEITEERTDGTRGLLINKHIYLGLTKRQYFAGVALSGILAGKYATIGIERTPEEVAKHAIECADALLIELQK